MNKIAKQCLVCQLPDEQRILIEEMVNNDCSSESAIGRHMRPNETISMQRTAGKSAKNHVRNKDGLHKNGSMIVEAKAEPKSNGKPTDIQTTKTGATSYAANQSLFAPIKDMIGYDNKGFYPGGFQTLDALKVEASESACIADSLILFAERAMMTEFLNGAIPFPKEVVKAANNVKKRPWIYEMQSMDSTFNTLVMQNDFDLSYLDFINDFIDTFHHKKHECKFMNEKWGDGGEIFPSDDEMVIVWLSAQASLINQWVNSVANKEALTTEDRVKHTRLGASIATYATQSAICGMSQMYFRKALDIELLEIEKRYGKEIEAFNQSKTQLEISEHIKQIQDGTHPHLKLEDNNIKFIYLLDYQAVSIFMQSEEPKYWDIPDAEYFQLLREEGNPLPDNMISELLELYDIQEVVNAIKVRIVNEKKDEPFIRCDIPTELSSKAAALLESRYKRNERRGK